MSSRRGERGQVAGIEALPFGLLIFVAGTLLVVNVWGVVDSKFAADAAAREAARHVVEAAGLHTTAEQVQAEAHVAAQESFADHGKHAPLEVVVHADGDGLDRCTRIRVEVSTAVPAIRLPFLGGYGEAFDVVGRHSELVDPTRSGVGGRADCIS